MNELIPVNMSIDVITGIECERPFTTEEIEMFEASRIRAEAERLAKDAQDATEAAERLALATWIAGQSTLPEAARNALARATGVTLPALTTLPTLPT